MRCAIKLAGKMAVEFEKTDYNFERRSTVDKMVLNSILCYREIFQERQNQSMRQMSLLSYFRKFPQPSQPIYVVLGECQK
jgi:hypothetical protein